MNAVALRLFVFFMLAAPIAAAVPALLSVAIGPAPVVLTNDASEDDNEYFVVELIDEVDESSLLQDERHGGSNSVRR